MRCLAPLFLSLISLPLHATEVLVPVGTTAELTAALNTAQDGHVIELAAGTYVAPAGGWTILTPSENFTVRGAAGQTVVLDGQSARPLLRIDSGTAGSSIVFENLTFANGLSTSDGVAGGVTLVSSNATFVDCTFLDNNSDAPNTGGGALAAFTDSIVHVVDSHFEDNVATNEAGALKVGGDSQAYVHNTSFVANRTNVPGHRPSAAGGAIHVGNAFLDVTNSRFADNEAGCVGGALYSIGDFNGAPSPTSQVRLSHTTFEDNHVTPNGVSCNFFGLGGALHTEDYSQIDIYSSRFLKNTSEDGGAVSSYRSRVEIYDSTFRGNVADGSGARGNGGAIAVSSQDSSGDSENHPSAVILVRRSLFQGQYDGSGVNGLRGGCIWALGDTNRTFGLQGVTPMGTAAQNRTALDIEDSIFFDCDVVRQNGVVGSGVGGGLSLSHTDLTLVGSLVANCDATGTNAAGGGLRAISDSALTIDDTTFANNQAQLRSAAVDANGSSVDIDDSRFIDNSLISGSTGGVMTLTAGKNVIAGTIDLDMTGTVTNSTFTGTPQTMIRDADFACSAEVEPINSVRYNGNDFSTSPPDGAVYSNSVAGGSQTAAQLNSLTIVRTLCSNTNKSTVANSALGSTPSLATLVAAPPHQLGTAAAGDPAPPTEAFLGWGWSGASATLNGSPLAPETGLSAETPDTYLLVAGGDSDSATISSASTPSLSFVASPMAIESGQSSDLEWSGLSGAFVDLSIDRGVEITTPSASGAESVSPAATTHYRLHLVTEEGGAVETTTVFVDENLAEIFSDGFESGDTTAW